jgi:hypothetical protein
VIVLRPSSLRSSSTMGLGVSKEGPCQEPERPESVISSKLHGRQASIRQSTIRAKSKQPMPDPNELERRFTKVLVRPDSGLRYRSRFTAALYQCLCRSHLVFVPKQCRNVARTDNSVFCFLSSGCRKRESPNIPLLKFNWPLALLLNLRSSSDLRS